MKGGKAQGEHRKHIPCLHGSTPRRHFLSVEGLRMLLCWCYCYAHLHLTACPQLQRLCGVGRQGGGSISPLPVLAAELGCSQNFYFKTHSVHEKARGVCVAKPCSLLRRGSAAHGPRNFPFPLQGWCMFKAASFSPSQ